MAFNKLIFSNFIDSQIFVNEAAPNGFVISPVIVDDSNILNSYKISIIDRANNAFNVINIDNVYTLIVSDSTKLDFETEQSKSITIRVTDSSNIITDIPTTINILNKSNLNSIITRITPKASIKGTPIDITIYGNNFTEGGTPIVLINNEPVNISSVSNYEIVCRLIRDIDAYIYDVTVLNGYEQAQI